MPDDILRDVDISDYRFLIKMADDFEGPGGPIPVPYELEQFQTYQKFMSHLNQLDQLDQLDQTDQTLIDEFEDSYEPEFLKMALYLNDQNLEFLSLVLLLLI